LKKLNLMSKSNRQKNDEIAILSSIYPPDAGGPATFAVAYKSFLQRNGFKPKVVSYCDSNSHTYVESEATVQLISRQLNPVVRLLLMVYAIWKLCWKRVPLLANGCFIELALATFLAPKNFVVKIPGDIVWERACSSGLVTCSVQDFQKVNLPIKFKLLRFLFTSSLKKASKIVVPAPYLIDLALGWGVNPEKIFLVYNGVDTENFFPIETQKVYDVISVSRLVPVKNIAGTIECCARLGLSLLVVGDGPLMQELQDQAKNQKVNVTFAGNSEQAALPFLYNQARIMVLNSAVEATSYSLLEARACGLPAIANDGTGATEIITHNKDGILCGPSTGIFLEDALRELIGNEGLADYYGVNARNDTLKRFDRKNLYRQLLNLLLDNC
jgi:glycosyltransferase involved in cell wall biosynthesis